MSKTHAKLSASGSARWLNCAGSVAAEREYSDSSSVFAQEGTCAHEVADMCLRSGDSADHYYKQSVEGVQVDAEMVSHVQGYLDYVRDLAKGADLYPEQRVNFSPWVAEGFGTSDAIVIKDDVCHIIDLKYGKGVVVSAERNTQAMLYALGVFNEYAIIHDIRRFVLHIYQPRVSNFSTWEISLEGLLGWGEWVRQRVALALSEDAPRTAGEKQCMWCKAKAHCPELKRHTESVIMSEFDDLDDLQTPDKLTPEQLSQILSNKKLIESWLSAVEMCVYDSITRGEPISGYKLVEGRSNRQWSDESLAASRLIEIGETEDSFLIKKMISPAQAVKLIGKKREQELADLIVKPQGKAVLATAADPRPSINDVKSCFDDLTL